jgi:stage V sporulation protein B
VLALAAQGAMLASLGIDTALVHFGGKRLESLQNLSGLGIGASLLLGPVATVIAILTISFLYGDLLKAIGFWAYVPLLSITAVLMATFTQAVLGSAGRMVERSVLIVVRAFFDLAAAAFSVAALWGVRGILGLSFVGDWILAGTTICLLVRYGLPPATRLWNSKRQAALAVYGLRAHLGNILQGLNYRLDIFLVAFFLTTKEVGLYSVAVTAAELLGVVPTVLGWVILQRAAVLPSARASNVTSAATRLTSLVTLVGAFVLLLSGDTLIRLVFGQPFRSSALPLKLLLPGMWALGIWRNLTNDLAGRGYPEARSYTAGVAVVVTVALDLALIPRLGISGAALASTTAYCAGAGLGIRFFSKRTGVPARDLVLPRPSDIALAVSVIKSARRFLSPVPNQ